MTVNKNSVDPLSISCRGSFLTDYCKVKADLLEGKLDALLSVHSVNDACSVWSKQLNEIIKKRVPHSSFNKR